MNKNKWNRSLDDVKKVFDEVSLDFIERFAVGFNTLILKAGISSLKRVVRHSLLPDAEIAR